MKILKKLLVTLVILTSFSNLHAEILKEWKRVPIDIELSVNQERIVFINRNVKVGYPPSIKGKLRVQSSGGAVYLKATSSFPEVDMQMQDLENGEIFLFKLSATDKQSNNNAEAIKIIHNSSRQNNIQNSDAPDNQSSSIDNDEPMTQANALPAPAALIRYAAQSLYAPARTIEPVAGLSTSAIPRSKLTSLLPSLPVVTKPIAAWKLDGYTVVAVAIKNKTAQTIALDPRDLQGDFFAVSFMHPNIGHVGYPEDTTTAFIVIEGDARNGFLPEPVHLDKKRK